MDAFIRNAIDAGYVWVVAIILLLYILGKYAIKIITVVMICKNPELSDQKVNSITQMISKNLFKL